MYIPVDEHGQWVTISILNCRTLCAFQSAGEVVETADMFEPTLKVKAKSIELAEWESTLTDAMVAGVLFAVEFLVRGSPKVVPIAELLDEVRQRVVRRKQYATQRPREFVKMR